MLHTLDVCTSLARMSNLLDLEHSPQWERVAVFAAGEREKSRFEAGQLAVLTDAYDEVLSGPHGADETAYKSLFAAFAVEARLTDHAVAERMSIGHAVRHTFVETGAAFSAGDLSYQHVRAIVDAASSIAQDPVLVPLYEAQIVEFAKTTTVGCVRSRAKQIIATLDDQSTAERHRTARQFRHVRKVECDDGMGELIAYGPMVLIEGAHDLLTRQGTGFEAFAVEGDTRLLDQVRCDIALDKLLSGTGQTLHGTGLEALKGHINVTLSAKMLSGDADGMAELDGHGALDPETAFELAGLNPVWTKLFLDNGGQVVSTCSYSPTAQMRRTLMARDKTCRFPGCRMPVARCQLDHTDDWAKGGKTELSNLGHLCIRHHALKHPQVDENYRWNVEQLEPGVLAWKSPTGHVYIDKLEARVMFVEATSPPEADRWAGLRPQPGETWAKYLARFPAGAAEPAHSPC